MIVSPNRAHNRTFFYKYTSAKTAATILITKKVRFSSPLLFNDPFDIPRKLTLAFSGVDLFRAVIPEMARLARDPGYEISSNPDPTMRYYLTWMRSFQPKHYENLLQDVPSFDFPENVEDTPAFAELQQKWTEFLPKTRILSLTEENDNPVMWHNYSDAYKGAVLQLDCLDIYDSILLLAKPITYSDNIPTIGSLDVWVRQATGQTPFDYDTIFGQLEITKQTKWAYEKEWRVISFEKDSDLMFSDYELHPDSFSRIFLGKDVTAQDRKLFLDLANYELSKLQVYDMTLDQTNRKIVFNRIK